MLATSSTGLPAGSSASTTITVTNPLVITSQPVDRTVMVGSNATFAVVAGGGGPVLGYMAVKISMVPSGLTSAPDGAADPLTLSWAMTGVARASTAAPPRGLSGARAGSLGR